VRHIPIRVRVAAAFAIAMALVLTATSLFLYARLGTHLADAIERNLRLRAQDLTAVVSEPGGSLGTLAGIPFVEHGESYAQLLDAEGRVLDATRPLNTSSLLRADELRAALRGPMFIERSSVPGLDEPSRMLTSPLTRDGEKLVLVVGLTVEDRNETLASLRNILLIAGPVALALATLAGYVLAGFSLRPVESMRNRAAEISAETTGERLPVPESGDEIARLAETLNAMLDRLELALEHERDFVADAGHELRTPLALLRTELELSLRHAESPGELREAVRRSSEEVDRLAQLADDLLLIARTERGKLKLRLEPLAISDLLGSVARRFEWRAHEAGRPLQVLAEVDATVSGDRLRLEQALSNLVDNALRHGSGQVELSAALRDGSVELHVKDKGAGFPSDFLPQAFERFARSDRARSRGGAGLGLSIVRLVAEAHGGEARVATLEQGGADAYIVLPCA
jgi:signal transduction histidine kinase